MITAGGDLGAYVGPQLIGVITDAAIASPELSAFAADISLAPEQLGMLIGALFPLAAIPVYYRIYKTSKQK